MDKTAINARARRSPVMRSPSGEGRNGQFRGSLWRDLGLASALAIGAGVAAFAGAQCIPSKVAASGFYYNVWFEADPSRVVANMSSLDSDQYRTGVHPLFPLMTYPLVKLLRTVGGLPPFTAIRIVMVTLASLWVGTLFILLRTLGCHRFDAALFTLLAAASASAMFWLVMPETYAFGSLTILLGLMVVAVAQRRALSSWWYVAMSVLTLSVTVTNWMVGLFATFTAFDWRKAMRLTVIGLCCVAALWGVEKQIFPTARNFLDQRGEATFLFSKSSGGPTHILNAFVFHSMVMPAIGKRPQIDKADQRFPIKLSVQDSRPGSGTLWGVVGLSCGRFCSVWELARC